MLITAYDTPRVGETQIGVSPTDGVGFKTKYDMGTEFPCKGRSPLRESHVARVGFEPT